MTSETPTKRRSRIWLLLYFLLLVILVLAAVFLFGPREPVDLFIRADTAALGSDLDAYLAEKEAKFDDIRPNAVSEIVWAYPASRAKTPVSLVYLHGFSAAKGEIRPVPDDAAKTLGANLFYSRLAGHGRDGDAMAEPNVNDWVNDAAEAIAIGERIGETVVIVSTSTGSTLATLAATLPALKDKIAGIVLISPNFAVQASSSRILTFPYARTLVPLVAGQERSFETRNEEHGANWTSTYPSVSLLPMGALVAHVRALPFENITVPALFIYHPQDSVVRHDVTAEVVKRWGGPAKTIEMTTSGDPNNHVIAGDIMSPENNAATAAAIVEFVNGL